MQKSSNYTLWLVIITAVIALAGIYYWRSNTPKCSTICSTTEDGTDCAVVCQPGVSEAAAEQAKEEAANIA